MTVGLCPRCGDPANGPDGHYCQRYLPDAIQAERDKAEPDLSLAEFEQFLAVESKPCLRRLNTIPLSWCVQADGHQGPCSAPPVRPIELDDLGQGAAKRRRW